MNVNIEYLKWVPNDPARSFAARLVKLNADGEGKHRVIASNAVGDETGVLTHLTLGSGVADTFTWKHDDGHWAIAYASEKTNYKFYEGQENNMIPGDVYLHRATSKRYLLVADQMGKYYVLIDENYTGCNFPVNEIKDSSKFTHLGSLKDYPL